MSLLPVWQMRMEKRAVEAKAAPSFHVGTVGKREAFEVEVIGERHFESDFGTKTLITLRTREGALIKWWASGDYGFLPAKESGEFMAVVATVKAHGQYNGRPETTVNRVAPPPAPKTRKSKKETV